MKRPAIALTLFLTLIAAQLTSSTPALAVKATGGAWVDELVAYDTARWTKADGWSNGAPFNVGWRADHVTFAGGVMTLQLDNIPCPAGCSGEPYASGEYRTNQTYSYGRYEARLKAASGSGLVTSFFIYTGPSERPPTPWDEIDIEILGRDPTKLQTNYFTFGVGGHEAVIDLGFDASAGFHTYAFEWSASRIVWYVDGIVRHVEDGSRGPLPRTPGKLMMNLWTGDGVDSWLGAFYYTDPVTAAYEFVSAAPAGSPPPSQATPLHVQANAVAVVRAGSRYQGIASVRIVDAAGIAVSGVTVKGSWSGATASGNSSIVTDGAGVAVFYSSRSNSPGPFTLCVTDAVLAGWRYDLASNEVTCDTASY